MISRSVSEERSWGLIRWWLQEEISPKMTQRRRMVGHITLIPKEKVTALSLLLLLQVLILALGGCGGEGASSSAGRTTSVEIGSEETTFAKTSGEETTS